MINTIHLFQKKKVPQKETPIVHELEESLEIHQLLLEGGRHP